MLTSSLTRCASKLFLATLLATAPAVYAQKFELKSPDITQGKAIAERFVLNGFGCAGGNLSPALEWRGAPQDTKSFALMVHDPDAKTGGAGFWHWVVINIPATTTNLAQGAGSSAGNLLPTDVLQINTDFGAPGWGGPCPPQGDKPHRYVFTLYALKVATLELPTNPTASLTGFMVNTHAIGKVSLTSSYGR